MCCVYVSVMLFRRKKQPSEIQELNNALDNSFRNVRQDIYNIFSWLNYLNDRILTIQKQVDQKPSDQQIKNIIDQNYNIENISRKMSDMHEQIDHIARKQAQFPDELDEIRTKLRKIAVPDEIPVYSPKVETRIETEKLDEINERLKQIEENRKRNIRETMVKRITKNSKEYVKNVIVNMIRKYGKIPALKLKEMVVDEQGLCSKSSFYRLLNEVQAEADVTMNHKGKEKQMVFKLSKNY